MHIYKLKIKLKDLKNFVKYILKIKYFIRPIKFLIKKSKKN